MKKHLIESYYKWVYSRLRPILLLQAGSEKVKAYLVTSRGLKEALKTQLLRDSLEHKTDMEMRFLVQRYQMTVTILLDHLFLHGHNESINAELKQFYEDVAADLEEIIRFLQSAWGRYFNADQNMPLSLWIREGREVKKQWKGIAKTLRKSEENIQLVNILNGCINELLNPAEGPVITYGQLSWFKNLFREICGHHSTTAPGYASLTELLISWNFNDPAFINEVCNNIRKEVEKKESDEFRIEFLRGFSKQVGQLLEKVHVPFHPVQPAAKRMMLDWMEQELAYLEVTTVAPETKKVKEGTKIHTSLTVPVLALITRLLKDSGILTNPNQTEILKFFTAHFTTQHKSAFSYGHLHSKYYQIDEGTKKKVYDYLMVMAQLCKKL